MRDIGDEAGLLQQYLDEIGREPLLTKEDEASLGEALERGRRATEELRHHHETLTRQRRAALEELVAQGERSRDRFIRANLRLVVAVAKQWTRSGLGLSDLIQEGNVGLMRAVERFDHRRGFRFSTYATWWIRQGIARGVANSGRLVRLPVRTGDELTRVLREQRRLEERDGRPPPIDSVASACGLPPESVSRLLQLAPSPVSMAEPMGDDGSELGSAIADTMATSPAEAAAAAALPAEVDRLLGLLDATERKVMSLRFGLADDEPWSLEAIARTLDLSPQKVRQSQARSLRILRRAALASPETRELLAV